MKNISKFTNQFTTYYQKHAKRNTYLLSFLLPVILFMCYLIPNKVTPFGENTLLGIDLLNQYIDFYAYVRTMIQTGEWQSIFYSFSKGLGGAMIGTWAYYLMSPFMWFIVLLPKAYLPQIITFVITLKIGLSGLSFQYLLGRTYKEFNARTLTFSLAYALMSFTTANIINIMWLDVVVLLPIIIYALDNLTKTKNIVPYAVVLAIAFISNFYIGFMVALFIPFFYLYFVIKHYKSIKEATKTILPFGVGSLLAGGIASFLIIPTAFELIASKGQTVDAETSKLFLFNLTDFLSKMTIGALNHEQITKGYPNLFVGTIAAISFILYFTNQRIALKERITALMLTVLFAFIMVFEPLNTLFHGGREPIWFPTRYSFIISFFALYIGYQDFRLRSKYRVQFIYPATFITIAFITFLVAIRNDYTYLRLPYITIHALTMIGLLLCLLLFQYNTKLSTIFILGITAIELAANTSGNLSAYIFTNTNVYQNGVNDLTTVINELKAKENDFYRIEKTFGRSINDAMQYDFKGVQHFNSTVEYDVANFMQAVGVANQDHVIAYDSPTPLVDMLLGIHYFIDADIDQYDYKAYLKADFSNEEEYQTSIDDRPITKNYVRHDLNKYELTNIVDNYLIYRNPYSLSLGYTVPESVKELSLDRRNMLLDNQNDLITALNTSEDRKAFVPVETALSVQNTVNLKQNKDNYEIIEPNKAASITYSYQVPTNETYYFSFEPTITNNDYYLTIEIDGEEKELADGDKEFITVASNEAGKTKDIRFNYYVKTFEQSPVKDPTFNVENLAIYQLNQDVISDLYQSLNQDPFTVTSMNDTHVAATLEHQSDNKMLMMSVPYNKAWTITVDGQPVEAIPLLDGAFTGIPLTNKGQLTIELHYFPRGLMIGAAVSIVSIIVLITYGHIYKKKHKKVEI